MNLRIYLSSMLKPELDELKEICNFTDEEKRIFDDLSKKQSRAYIADKYSLSCTTVSNRTRSIQKKIERARKGDVGT